jgi:hypothetical protein
VQEVVSSNLASPTMLLNEMECLASFLMFSGMARLRGLFKLAAMNLGKMRTAEAV